MFRHRKIVMRFSSVAWIVGLAGICALPASATNWPVFGYDPARSGVDGSQRVLTVSNVNKLRSRWQVSLGAVADSTPILLEGVKTGRISRTLLFQTATNGTTFGIDAASGRILWRFGTNLPWATNGNYSPIEFLRRVFSGLKVTASTPAADPSGQSIYAPGLDGFVHKLDAATGTELRGNGFPVRITLLPQTEKDASPLNVANGYLYVTTSGYYGDAPPYDGHIVSVRLNDGATTVFNSLCSWIHSLPTATSCPHSGSGIWSRGGVVVDPDPAMNGRIYVATGNGDFNANAGGQDYGDSLLALSVGASTLLGHYTPADYRTLDEQDTDLGSTSPALLPRQRASRTPLMLVQGGKDSVLKLLNRAPLPGLGNELQRVQLVAQLYSTPAVWTDAADRAWIFIGLSQEIDAYRLDTDAGGISRLTRIWSAHVGKTEREGTSPVVSNGIVFDALDGAVVALDARNGHELWSSAWPSAGRSIGAVHWQSPIVINGWLYCADENGNLTAYALPGP
jgi:outer membrane protein assembly factor BamB